MINTIQIALQSDFHEKAMLLFKEYMLVGRMPQSVSAFIGEKKDLNAADDVKQEILNLYRDDIRKVPASYKSYISKIFDQIPGLLSKHEKRVVFSELKSKSQADSYEESFFLVCGLHDMQRVF